MEANDFPGRVVLDTNVIVSALVFGGLPELILRLVKDRKIVGVISPILLAENLSVLANKFGASENQLRMVEKLFKRKLVWVYPNIKIKVLADEPDNRVLEAAVVGRCNTIVTGDKELLALSEYEGVRIVSVAQFVSILELN